MSLLHGFLPTNRNAEAAGTTPTHTDGSDSPNNIMRAPNASVSGRRDTVRLTLPDKTLSVAETTPRYSKRPSGKFKSSAHFSFVCILLVYYRIYAEDGAIPSKTPVAPGDPFLGCIKARSVPPPHTAKAVKRSIAKVEDIKDRTSTSLFFTSYSQSPMSDADKVTIRNRTGPGSTPQEPLALVAKMSESERSALESDGRGGHANTAAEPDTTPQEIRYRTSIQHSPTFLFIVISRLLGEVYYLLYADDYEIPSKVALDPEEPSLGRIRADSVVPPHSPASIKRCISRVERTPALVHADLFADTSCDAPLEEGYISILRTDGSGPGLSPNEPMAIVHIESPSIPDGIYLIKNRAANLYWNAGLSPTTKLYFGPATMKQAKKSHWAQVNKHSLIVQMFK